jgi:hypothetical protein
MTRGLTVTSVPEEWMRPDEPDERDAQLRKLEREVSEMKAASPDLRLLIQGNTHAAFTVKERPPLSRQDHLGGIVLGGIGAAHSADPEVDEYNVHLNEFFKAYEEYLSLRPVVLARKDRTISLTIHVENNGTRSAEDVDVILTADAEGRWREKLPPTVGRAPVPPTRPEPFGGAESVVRGMWRNEHILSRMPVVTSPFAPRVNAVGRPLRHDTPRELSFHVHLVKPGLPEKLPKRYFEFASFDAAKSFTISYRLVAKNLPAPKQGALHIKIVGN